MAGRIPQAFIDELIARADIVEIIGSRVPLKRAGREYKACCPFHDEKTPSFWVSPDKQFYHCFGCGAHGTALGFLMEYDRLPFPEAVEDLAARLGLTPVPEHRIVLAGARDLDPPEVTYLASAQIKCRQVADLTAADLPAGPLYVHVDLDVIDAAELPGLRYPAPGGPGPGPRPDPLRRHPQARLIARHNVRGLSVAPAA